MTLDERMNLVYSRMIGELAEGISSRIVNRMIRLLQSFKRNSNMMMTSEDSVLENVWDEVCVQTQYAYFIFWNAYEETIMTFIEKDIEEKCSEFEKKILWLQTSSFDDWYSEWDSNYRDIPLENAFDKNGFPDGYNFGAVIDYIFSQLMAKSMDYTNSRIEEYLFPPDRGLD